MWVSICVSSYGDISSSSSPAEKEHTQALANNRDIIYSLSHMSLTAKEKRKNTNQTVCDFSQILCKKVQSNKAKIWSENMNKTK